MGWCLSTRGGDTAETSARPGESAALLGLQTWEGPHWAIRTEPHIRPTPGPGRAWAQESAPSPSPPRLGDTSIPSGQLHSIDGLLQAKQDHCGHRVVRAAPARWVVGVRTALTLQLRNVLQLHVQPWERKWQTHKSSCCREGAPRGELCLHHGGRDEAASPGHLAWSRADVPCTIAP